MYWYQIAAFAYRIKFHLHALLVIFLVTGDTNHRKEMLWEEFELAFMQEIPMCKATFRRVHDFDVVFQQVNSYTQHTCYAEKYIIGKNNLSGNRFERIHLLSRVDPFQEYRLVKTISDLYQTDTTYLDVLSRNKRNELESIIYRKVNPCQNAEVETEYIMWKKEKIIVKKDTIRTQLINKWNSHLFE